MAFEPKADAPLFEQISEGYEQMVYTHDREGDVEKACLLGKAVFDYGITRLDTMDETEYMRVVVVMQKIRDSIILYTEEMVEWEDGTEVKGAVD